MEGGLAQAEVNKGGGSWGCRGSPYVPAHTYTCTHIHATNGSSSLQHNAIVLLAACLLALQRECPWSRIPSYTFKFPRNASGGTVLTSNSQGRFLQTLGSTTVSPPRCLIAFADKESYEKWLIHWFVRRRGLAFVMLFFLNLGTEV